MDSLAYETPFEQHLAIALLGSVLGLLATALTLGYASIGKKHPEGVASALNLWAVGAAPPMLFAAYALVTGLFARGSTARPEDCSLLGLSFVSVLFAPLWFCASLATARPSRKGLFIEVLRLSVFLGWLLSSAVTIGLAAAV
ncbi:hypothetical protein AKJ09_08187 [Labilithrix luteola]|uniref:Uncharacterized protein n=1 Tax=Labilithrix luteola TaxID=1391654 RepID=A0A0K1Q726_9BACT|nr:hypothetical protein [Labilithrix luteola]AKV01524.1 hypothetical protein AKJ09_08187 [Labilithrix luteola]